MRCPKCSFISFDIVETCAKCGKNISAAAKELHGTVAAISAPLFLRLGLAEPEPEAVQEGGAEAEVTFDLGGEEEEAVIDLGSEEAPSLDLGLEEMAMEPAVAAAPDEAVAAEPVFAEPAAEAPQAESFDIADLAPPREEVMAEDLQVEATEEELEFAGAEPAPSSSERAGLGLADLRVEGIDLEAAPGKGKAMPAVKTGTALDDFDIDLGDLIPKKKK